MKLKRPGTLAGMAGIAVTATLAIAACGSDNNSGTTTPLAGASSEAVQCATGTLNAQGSTAQTNAINQWVRDYQAKCSGATINYQGTGSGAGQTAFISGTADFAGSDSPLAAGDQPKANDHCKSGPAIHLPMVVGPIAVVYNLQGVSNLQLKPATIAKIFSGAITKWDDPAIKADNSSATLPSTPILAVHRSDSSGTTDNFTKFLSKTAASSWSFSNDKNWKAPGGQADKGSDGISSDVSKNAGAIGYVEWSYAIANNLNMAKIGNGAGEFATLSADSAGKTIASAQATGTGSDLQLTIDYNTNAAGAYPIVLVTYEIVCEKGNPADKLPLIKGFLSYAASNTGQSGLTSLGYAPLPSSVQSKVTSTIATLG